MGHRLHVAKKYDVQYAGGSAFNYKVTEMHNLLDACCENEYPYNGDIYENEFEVSKEDWLEMIEVIKYVYGLDSTITKDDDWIDSDCVRQSCINLVKNEDEPLTEEEVTNLLADLQYFYDNAEPNESVLHLCFF
jgi:hypothetical protein